MKHLLWLCGAVLCALFVLPVWGADLATLRVKKQVLPLERWFEGTVEATHQSTVSAETSGRIQDILVDVGDYVTADTVILKLVNMEPQQSYNQAVAALQEAQSNLDVQTREYQRAQQVYAKQAISKSDFDRATGNYDTAKARFASAQANVKAADERLSYTEVRAPYSGKVSARLVEIGEAVHPGTPLLSGFDPNNLRVETDIPQTVADIVTRLHQARAVTDDGAVFIPVKLLIFPQVDPTTSTVRLRLDLSEQANTLHPGQFIKVAVVVGEAPRLLIPQSSIIHRSEITAVYVVDQQNLQFRQIRLGNKFKDNVEVLSGLTEGEKIALDPVAAGIEITTKK